MKQAVARMLGKQGLDPIILDEQSKEHLTIIEKLEKYAEDVSFAVVLFSPDDKVYNENQKSDSVKSRARQNVILELGYFIGKLKRKNVATLFKKDPEFEFPSDYWGVSYIEYEENSTHWQLELVKELKSLEYDVDANRLLS
jgi:predicted nucleotide-binding protein